MSEAAVVDQPAGSETQPGNQQTQSPGWLAGLPAELRDNEAFKTHKTVGDFARAHLVTAEKARDLEGKLANSITKLGANATQEERDKYLTALGRPLKAEDYKLEGEQADQPGWAEWKQEFHKIGVPADMALAISAVQNRRLNALVDQHKANVARQNADAEAKLKTEWGDKYPANVELAQRLIKGKFDPGVVQEADKAISEMPASLRLPIFRLIFDMAAKTGEDTSPTGAQQRTVKIDGQDPKTFYSKSNMPSGTR